MTGHCAGKGWLLAVVMVLGCGGSGTPGLPGDLAGAGDRAAPEVPGTDRGVLDVVFPVDLGEDATQTTEEAGGPSEVEDTAGGPEGCQSGEECDSGFCVETPGGEKVCAPLCLEDTCPAGWECKAVTNTGGDVTFICLPRVNRLCRPCEYHEDCRQPGLKTGDLCVDFGPEGKFCGRDCAADAACPEGYECREVEGAAGRGEEAARQCMPTSGECVCTQDFIENGFKTTCYRQNEYGTCYGKRQCAPGGLTPCDASVPRPEECNGLDENCDGQTDEGIAARECQWEFEGLVCKGPEVCEGGQWVCKAQEPGTEKCDGVDNDCDGVTDPEGAEGCANYYRDADGDAYGVTADFRCLCGTSPPHTALQGGDCDDQEPEVNPAAKEVCNGRDDDCDGGVDEEGAQGCQDYFRDEDQDGYGLGGDKKCLCSPVFPYTATKIGDCDDGDASVHPGVPDICNGRDDDCDGVKDPAGSLGCADHFYDHDADGVGVADNKKCLCGPEGKYAASKPGDCDDLDPGVYPGAVEKCNARDDDCDGQTDEDFPQKGQPCDGSDGDQCAEGTFVCNATGTGLDCTDLTDTRSEVCNNADDDCDGQTDEDLYQPCSSPCGVGTEVCIAGQWKNCSAMQPKWCTNYQNCGLESMCVTACPASPPESCNNKDDDCDGATDEDVTRPCSTMCGSGTETCSFGQWGNCTAQQPRNCLNYNNCQVEPMCVTSCPSAPTESCNNKDDNCNGQTDENLTRPCSTMCGSGMETCSYGQWINCTAAQPKYCYDYATCSYKNLCVASCPSAPAETCNLVDDNCNGTTDEGFIEDDYFDYNDGQQHHADLPNTYFGPTIGHCGADSCQRSLSARLLPYGDQDWMAVFKNENKANLWPDDIYGSVTFTGVQGRSYVVCICWTENAYCDQNGGAPLCGTSTNGTPVILQVKNDDDQCWPGDCDDSGFLDILVKPLGTGDASCSKYTVAWSVWE